MFMFEAQRGYVLTGDEAYDRIARMANIKIIRLRRQLKNLSYKPFHIMFERDRRNEFRKGDIITDGNNKYIVLNPSCKDSWWTNFKAWLGLRPTSIEFTTKVRQHD